MIVHLLRHGEVRVEGPERVYGDMEMPLSERGVAELERAGERLRDEKLDAVYASDLERARIGAAAVARPHGLEVRVERELREIFRGDWRGLTWAEVEARWPGGPEAYAREPATYRGHGGETLADVDRRARAAFGRIVDRHAGGRIAIVSHSWTIRCLLAAAVGAPVEIGLSIPVDPGSLSTLTGDPGAWRLVRFNERSAGDRTPPPLRDSTLPTG